MKKAYYRGIPAYFDPETNELMGRNVFYDILIDINIWFDVYIVDIEEFPIWIEKN
jgi:hypothetical protein